MMTLTPQGEQFEVSATGWAEPRVRVEVDEDWRVSLIVEDAADPESRRVAVRTGLETVVGVGEVGTRVMATMLSFAKLDEKGMALQREGG